MGKNLNKFFEEHKIRSESMKEILRNISTSFFDKGKSSLQTIARDLYESRGIKVTDLRLLEYVRVLEKIGLVTFDIQNAAYQLTLKGYEFYQ